MPNHPRPFMTLLVSSFLCTLLLATGAAAQALPITNPLQIFGSETGDTFSAVFLNQIFGPLFPVAGATSGQGDPTVFSSVIGLFNAIILTIGTTLFFYNVTIGLLQSAYEGKVLGARWSSLWAPLRIVFAVGLLVPMPNLGGYNLGQAGIAYLVRGSTVMASMAWSTVAELVIDHRMPITTQASTIDTSLVETFYQIAACKVISDGQYAAARQAAIDGGAGGTLPVYQVFFLPMSQMADPGLDDAAAAMAGVSPPATLIPGGERTFISVIAPSAGGAPDLSDRTKVRRGGVCGSFTLPDAPLYLSRIALEEARAGGSGNAQQLTNTFFTTHRVVAFKLLGDLYQVVAQQYPGAKERDLNRPVISADLVRITQEANEIFTRGIGQVLTDSRDAPLDGSRARSNLLARITGNCSSPASPSSNGQPPEDITRCYGEGWLGAGSIYMLMAQFNNEISTLMRAQITATSSSVFDGVVENTAGSGARREAMDAAGITSGTGFFWRRTEADMAAAGLANDEEVKQIYNALMASYHKSAAPLAALGYRIAQEDLNELNLRVTSDGWGILDYLPESFHNFLNSILMTMVSFTSPSNWGADPMIGLTVVGRMLLGLAGAAVTVATVAGFATGGALAISLAPLVIVMLTAGGILAFILPLMPFMFWIMAATGYFLLVAEAVVAVNLFALSHLRMDGEGISGEANRQGWILILSLLMTPVLMVFGFLIGMTVFRVTSGLLDIGINAALSGVVGGGLIAMLLAIVFYSILIAVLYMLLIERSFSLTATFPGMVLRWIGGGANIATGEDRVRTAAGVATYGTNRMLGGLGDRVIGKGVQYGSAWRQKMIGGTATGKKVDGD